MPTIPQNQIDLFIASATDASPKHQIELMSRNWFSLSKQKRIEPIKHIFGNNSVIISADKKYGLANIWDNDILIFIAAQYMKSMNEHSNDPDYVPGRTFQFSGYEYFSFIGKKRYGGKGYKDLWNGLQRLHHTFVETNLNHGEEEKTHSFNWITDIKQMKENGRHRGYEIKIADWLYDAVVGKKLVLTLDRDYFTIAGGLERFLYLFARKTAGYQQGGWSEGLKSIYKKSGTRMSYSEFSRKIRTIIKNNSILGYDIEPVEYQSEKGINFMRDSQFVRMVSEGRKTKGANKWRKVIKKLDL
jgi:plasmid replication initiation protein